jgi:lactoylglutathione lyase
MILNHLNLTVTDPAATSAFLAKYFGLRPRGGNLGMQLLNDDNGMVLTLTKARREDWAGGGDAAPAGTGAARNVRYPSSFHIGFIQPTRERVNEINQRLRDDGLEVGPPAHLHGSWTFYFQAPGGVTIEVLA